MLAPKFWYPENNEKSFSSLALIPLGHIYSLLSKLRMSKAVKKQFDIPIVCIGNLNAGGTGKTPTTISAAEFLRDRKYNVHIVSRGYGGNAMGPLSVNDTEHSADDVGDEALMLSAFAPTWVATKRSDGIQSAIKEGADIILLDDGFQDPSVYKDLSILTVNAKKGFGNNRCIPAGPLREKLSSGLERADVLISIGTETSQRTFKSTYKSYINIPLGLANLEVLNTGLSLENMKVLAFAGIAHPENFFDTLRAQGAEIVDYQALADHQKLSSTIMKRLIVDARAENAQLITTEKDYMRLPKEFRSEVMTLPVRIKLNETLSWEKIFKPILSCQGK